MAYPAYNSSIKGTASTATSFTDEAMTDSGDRTVFVITDQSKRYLDRATAVVVQAAHDELQTVTLTGGPTGGDFTLTFGGDTTAAIAYNAAASVVQAALEALASIGAGNVLVTGSAGGPWTVRFTASLGQADQAQMTADGGGLTGGSSPDVDVTTTQEGSDFTTISSGFSLRLVGAILTFDTQQALGTAVRLHSGKYLAAATIGKANTLEFNAKLNVVDTTYFDENATGAHTFTPTLHEGDVKLHVWWESNALAARFQARDLLILSINLSNVERFEGYIYYSELGIKTDVSGVVESDLALKLSEPFFLGV